MINVTKDKYDLGQSENISISKNAQEVRLDLDLRINYKNKTGAIITGTVKDEYGLPLFKALVKLMTDEYKPIIQTRTDQNGNYTLARVPINVQMKLFAGAKGKKLQDGILIAPTDVKLITIDFTLEEDPSSKFGIISGHVLDKITNEPVNEAMVYLFLINKNNNIIVSVIYTNEYGQFVFRDVSLGQYLIRITSPKYKVFNTQINLTQNSEIIPLDIFLEQKPKLYSGGVISGVIKDKDGNIVPNANVILYKVEFDKDDNPVNFTTTNIEGVYYFNNIPKGNYKIKCTQMQYIDINEPVVQQGILSPNFYKFQISDATSNIPINFNVLDGVFSNNNGISNLNGFAQGIGGPDNNFIEITINIPSRGIYKMGIQYVSANASRILKFNVNGVINSYIFLVLPQTNSWNSVDAQTSYKLVNFIKGANKIRFYNDTGNYAPALGKITFSLNSRINEVNAADGYIKGNASITNSPGINFVKGLGGDINNLGYVEVILNSSVRRTYDLYIQYLSGNEDGKLSVDVNGENTGVEYVLPKTDNFDVKYSKTYNITINLEKGKNKIKLYNNTNSIAPWIGNLIYKAQFNSNFKSATTGELNGAQLVLNNTMVGGLGGSNKGEVILNIETQITAKYLLIIQCATNNDQGAPLSVEINSLNNTNFVVAKTGANSVNDSVYYSLNTTLFDGINQIRIYNASNLQSAYVGNVEWTLIEPFTVQVESIFGRKFNGAKFTWKGKTVGLGGSNKGILKISPNVFSYGHYKISFKYLTDYSGGAPINLYVNNELIESCTLLRTNYNSIDDAMIASTIGDFDGNSNDLFTLYNYTGIRNLDIGDIYFEKIIAFNEVFYAKDVETFNGAEVIEEIILGIGESLGQLTFVVDAPQTGKYDLIIYYLAEDDSRASNISVNWVNLPNSITFEKTNSMSLSDIKSKVVTLDLSEGNNIIKVYNGNE